MLIFAYKFEYMSTFHSLKIKDIKRETPGAVSIAFEIPNNLKEDYAFIAGQYINICL